MDVSGANRAGRAAVTLVALLLAGCVDSAAPLLEGAKPAFGPTVRMHVYTRRDGRASGPEAGVFRWDGTQYRVVGRPTFDVASFTAVPFAGDDLIIQAKSSRPQIKGVEYAVAHKAFDGVYLVSVIDEEDADPAARANFCAKGGSDTCRIATREALLAFARASAAKAEQKGALVVLLGDH
jgi:hypothetical protein